MKPPRRVHTKGFRLQRGSLHCCMQLNCWASAPPAALPWESIELRLTTLRPFGGARIPGFPPASQRTSTTRPSLRTAYPKITPVSATSTATLDCTTRPPIDSCCSTPFTHFVALHPTRKASPAAPTITEPSSVIGCVRRAVYATLASNGLLPTADQG